MRFPVNQNRVAIENYLSGVDLGGRRIIKKA
jgi:hypothetical protein